MMSINLLVLFIGLLVYSPIVESTGQSSCQAAAEVKFNLRDQSICIMDGVRKFIQKDYENPNQELALKERIALFKSRASIDLCELNETMLFLHDILSTNYFMTQILQLISRQSDSFNTINSKELGKIYMIKRENTNKIYELLATCHADPANKKKIYDNLQNFTERLDNEFFVYICTKLGNYLNNLLIKDDLLKMKISIDDFVEELLDDQGILIKCEKSSTHVRMLIYKCLMYHFGTEIMTRGMYSTIKFNPERAKHQVAEENKAKSEQKQPKKAGKGKSAGAKTQQAPAVLNADERAKKYENELLDEEDKEKAKVAAKMAKAAKEKQHKEEASANKLEEELEKKRKAEEGVRRTQEEKKASAEKVLQEAAMQRNAEADQEEKRNAEAYHEEILNQALKATNDANVAKAAAEKELQESEMEKSEALAALLKAEKEKLELRDKLKSQSNKTESLAKQCHETEEKRKQIEVRAVAAEQEKLRAQANVINERKLRVQAEKKTETARCSAEKEKNKIKLQEARVKQLQAHVGALNKSISRSNQLNQTLIQRLKKRRQQLKWLYVRKARLLNELLSRKLLHNPLTGIAQPACDHSDLKMKRFRAMLDRDKPGLDELDTGYSSADEDDYFSRRLGLF